MKKFNYVTNLPVLQTLKVEETDGRRHYVSPNGLKLPSVTTVLGHFGKHKILEWKARVGEAEAQKISTRASIRGTKFHSMMERYLANEQNIFEDVMPDMKQAFLDVKKEIDKIDNIHYIESMLFSEVIGIAGRTDVIGEYDYVPSIIDFKTSTRPKKREWILNYFEQGTAYSLMYEEMTGIQINQIVVIVSVDGADGPQVFIEDRNDHIDNLMTKVKAYQKEHGYVC